VEQLVQHAKSLADIIVYVWLFVLAMALLVGHKLNQFGGSLRTLPGFWSPPVVEAIHRVAPPFDNAETLLLLGGLLLLRGTRDWLLVTLIALLVDCVNAVCFPTVAKRAGLNSVLFTYLGFLLLRSYFELGLVAILMTIVVGCLCSRMLWGMMPNRQNPMWKTYFLNFLGGIGAAASLNAIAPYFPVSNLW